MKQLLYLFCFLISFNCIGSPNIEEWWQAANNHYKQKQFDSAAVYYEKIAALNPDEAAAYYNLGNAYYKLNQIGPAVLNYEKAIKIDPSNKEAKDNLYLTQNRIPNRILNVPDIFFVQWWHSLTSADKANMWAIVSVLLFLVFIGSMLAQRLRRIDLPAQLYIGICAIWFLSLIIAYTAAQKSNNNTHAVVMQGDAPFMSTPGKGKTQSLVPEGTTVKLRSEQNNWLEITLPDGRTGWIEKGAAC